MAGFRPSTVGMRKLSVTVSLAGTQVPISATQLFVTDFEVYVNDSNAGANMYIGDSTVDNTWIPRPKGETINFTHGDGTLIGPAGVEAFDLSRIYLDADAANDNAIIQYFGVDVA